MVEDFASNVQTAQQHWHMQRQIKYETTLILKQTNRWTEIWNQGMAAHRATGTEVREDEEEEERDERITVVDTVATLPHWEMT